MSFRLKHAKGKHVAGRAKHARDSPGRVHGFRLRPIVTMATVATVLAAWALLTTPGSASGAGSAPTVTAVTPNVGPTGGIAHERRTSLSCPRVGWSRLNQHQPAECG